MSSTLPVEEAAHEDLSSHKIHLNGHSRRMTAKHSLPAKGATAIYRNKSKARVIIEIMGERSDWDSKE